MHESAQSRGKLSEVASLFLKLGFIAFGGPAAHIGMMEDEVVTKRKWMSREHFLDLVGATNLIPGPNSTEMTMHCGYHRAGITGLFVAGICFILPAVILTGILAWLYVKYGTIPAIEPFLYGIKPAVLAIIVGAIYKLGKKALKNWQLGLIGISVIVASFLGVNEITSILSAGVIGMLWLGIKNGLSKAPSVHPLALLLSPAIAIKSVSSMSVFITFLKIGTVLFGSGYVLVAYLDGEIVQKLGWITKSQLLDAIAIGQFTPGPVLSTSTFVGYIINDVQGAIAATLGIFLPSFFFVWILNPLVPKLRKSPLTAGFLDAVNIAAVGIMIAVTIRLGANVLVDWKSWTIALLSVIIFFGWKRSNALWIVALGIVLGYIFHLAGK